MKKCTITLFVIVFLLSTPHTKSSIPLATPPIIPAAQPPTVKPPTIPAPIPVPTAIPIPSIPPVTPTPPVVPALPKVTPPGIPIIPTPPTIIPAASPGVPLTPKPGLPTAPTISPYKQQAKQIGDGMTKINTLKDELKGMMRTLDEKIIAMRKKITEAKTQSFKILQSGTEPEAQEQLKKIEAILREAQALQTATQTETSKNFNTKIAEISSQTSMVTTLINMLKAQGAFKQATPFIPPQIPSKPKQPTKTEAQEKLPLKTRIMNFITNVTAYIITATKKSVNWILEPPKKKKIETTKPAGPPTTGLTQPTSGAATNMLKFRIPQLSKILEHLDHLLLAFTQRYQQIKQVINMVKMQIDAYPELKKRLKISHKPSSDMFKDMSLKDMAMHVVSKALDLTALIFRTTKNVAIKGYNAIIHPAVQKISKDVSKKLEEMEKKEVKPLTLPIIPPVTPPSIPAAISPVIPPAGIPVAKPATPAVPSAMPMAKTSDEDEDEDDEDE